jgi:4-hydroxy-3-methylbut-2-enyl diphosphate reductase
MQITIDDKSGFCFGVTHAIASAEEVLSRNGKLYCLGTIVHNKAEVERLEKLGLIIITHDTFKDLKNTTVLIRAHGEPPETYEIAKNNNIILIDASCKVVLNIQKQILKTYSSSPDAQIVIYGKHNHPEVQGLIGQVNGNAIVIQGKSDIDSIDFSRSIHFFSQTTMPLEGFREMADLLCKRMIEQTSDPNPPFYVHDTVCRQVSNRAEHLRNFALNNDIIVFASSKESSNGKVLFDEVKKVNPNCHFVSNLSDIQKDWFLNIRTVGICGATSTPYWFMKQIENEIDRLSV